MFSGQGRFDGMEVELYEGKFAGGFDLEEDEGEQVSYDTTFVFMVTAVAGKTTFDVTNQGDVKRVTQFDLRDVVILNPEDANAQFVLQELAGNLLGADELEGQGSVLAAIADAEADDEVELTDLEVWDDDPVEVYEDEDDSQVEHVGTMGAQTVGTISKRTDSSLQGFLDGPAPAQP